MVWSSEVNFHSEISMKFLRCRRIFEFPKDADNVAYLHDPLTIGCVIDDTFCTFKELPIEVLLQQNGDNSIICRTIEHPQHIHNTTRTIRCAVAVNALRFRSFFVQRLTSHFQQWWHSRESYCTTVAALFYYVSIKLVNRGQYLFIWSHWCFFRNLGKLTVTWRPVESRTKKNSSWTDEYTILYAWEIQPILSFLSC